MNIKELGQSLEERVGDNLNEIGQQVVPQIARAKEGLRSLDGQARRFIKEHPAACLLGALGLGFLLARIARR